MYGPHGPPISTRDADGPTARPSNPDRGSTRPFLLPPADPNGAHGSGLSASLTFPYRRECAAGHTYPAGPLGQCADEAEGLSDA